MSILIPECNAQIQGNNANAVAIVIPAAASYKPANRGFVAGIWVEVPQVGYESNVNYNVLTRGTGATSGNDGYLRFNQMASQLSANFRSGGAQLLPALTLSGVAGAGKRMLVMLIATANDTYVVACEAVAGAAALYAKGASPSTGIYAANLSASDCWNRIGPGYSVSYGHYGPVEEAFFLLGEFPEVSGAPDLALVQAIADGTQDLDTLHTLIANGTRKWRYRMRQQDELTDSWGLAGALTLAGADANKVFLSGGPLRPTALRPTYGRRMATQVTFGTPGVAASAKANIAIEGGSYVGITPARIEARLRKEDGSVLVNWQTVDAAPAGGVWQPSQFVNVPGTAGWLTCDFRAVDGVGAQIGGIVSSHQIKGAGFSLLKESQSQGYYLVAMGAGLAVPADARFCATHLGAAGALPFRCKTMMPGNALTRLARGAVQTAIELHTLYPGWPISFASIGITGQSLQSYIYSGTNAWTWAAYKSFMGVIQPYYLYFYGHSSQSGSTVDGYKTSLADAVARATADIAAPIKVLHGQTARYAGASNAGGADGVQVRTVREAIRKRVAEAPAEFVAGCFHDIKCEAGDAGPHPMDGNTGQGRVGAQIAWGVMMACRAVEDVPLTITAARLITGGTELELTIDKVNA